MAPSELAAAIDRHVQEAVAKDGFSGVVLVAREGTVVFEKAYGLANRTFYPTEQARAATVEQLLEHEGGIADFLRPHVLRAYQGRVPIERLLLPLRVDTASAFRARRQYYNGCYIVLGAIIERLSGTTYEDYIAEHVFARAGIGMPASCGRRTCAQRGQRLHAQSAVREG